MNLSYLSLTLVALFVEAHGQSIHFRGNANQNQVVPLALSSDDPSEKAYGDVLMSAACDVFRQEVGMADPKTFIASFIPTEGLVSYICSSVGRSFFKIKLGNLKKVSDPGNPCAMDLQSILNAEMDGLQKIVKDEHFCRTEIGSEIEQWKGEHPSNVFLQGFWFIPIIFVSDERLKEDIHYVGKSPSGIPLYTFKYREEFGNVLDKSVDTENTYFGVMAQDLLKLAPDAVMKSPDDGYYRVDYSSIDVKPMKLT